MQLNCRRRSAMQLTQLQRTANQREAGQSIWVELSCVAIDTSPTQLNSTSSWVELCRYKRALIEHKASSRGLNTKLSAVAERPGDASCLSVVNFNSTIPRAQSNYLLRLQIYQCVQLNSVLFSSGYPYRLAVINKIHGCVALRRQSAAINKRRPFIVL